MNSAAVLSLRTTRIFWTGYQSRSRAPVKTARSSIEVSEWKRVRQRVRYAGMTVKLKADTVVRKGAAQALAQEAKASARQIERLVKAAQVLSARTAATLKKEEARRAAREAKQEERRVTRETKAEQRRLAQEAKQEE